MSDTRDIIGLDIGARKIGIARMSPVACLPEPLLVSDTARFSEDLARIVSLYQPQLIVVGLPRNMSGEKTAQTSHVEQFCAEYVAGVDVPHVFQDETLSTKRAQQDRRYADDPQMEDAIAACIILDDYAHSSGLVQ